MPPDTPPELVEGPRRGRHSDDSPEAPALTPPELVEGPPPPELVEGPPPPDSAPTTLPELVEGPPPPELVEGPPPPELVEGPPPPELVEGPPPPELVEGPPPPELVEGPPPPELVEGPPPPELVEGPPPPELVEGPPPPELVEGPPPPELVEGPTPPEPVEGPRRGRQPQELATAPSVPVEHRSGFACFVGRPNAGKSTLTNALVGTKIAIASAKPQTTRHAIRAVVHRSDAQLVLVDTPGLHRPRTLLGERLNDLVRATWTEVDVVGVCLPANQRIGPGDTYLVGELAALPRTPVLVAVATKSDLVSSARMAQHLTEIAALEGKLNISWAHIVPVSSRDWMDAGSAAGSAGQLDVLADALVSLLPEGPPLYPEGQLTDEPTETLVAELIREAALEGVRDELPHSITVAIEEMGLREDRPADKPLLDVYASMIVERDSQKGIVIGHRGARLREIGAASRAQIEALLGTPVYLDLRVKVLREWQRDPKYLNRLGF